METTIVRHWQPGMAPPSPCVTCDGRGVVLGGDEYQQCPGCHAGEWCDRCSQWCSAGTTQPYEPRSIYRICSTCTSSVQDDRLDAYEAAHGADFHQLPESIKRQLAGDR